MSTYYSLVLDGLRASEDIALRGMRYKVEPKGLTRLEQFDLEDEKFRMEHKLQRRMFAVSFGIVLLATIQAIIQISSDQRLFSKIEIFFNRLAGLLL